MPICNPSPTLTISFSYSLVLWYWCSLLAQCNGGEKRFLLHEVATCATLFWKPDSIVPGLLHLKLMSNFLLLTKMMSLERHCALCALLISVSAPSAPILRKVNFKSKTAPFLIALRGMWGVLSKQSWNIWELSNPGGYFRNLEKVSDRKQLTSLDRKGIWNGLLESRRPNAGRGLCAFHLRPSIETWYHSIDAFPAPSIRLLMTQWRQEFRQPNRQLSKNEFESIFCLFV